MVHFALSDWEDLTQLADPDVTSNTAKQEKAAFVKARVCLESCTTRTAIGCWPETRTEADLWISPIIDTVALGKRTSGIESLCAVPVFVFPVVNQYRC